MSAISTHVLDTSTGKPAQGVPVALEHRVDSMQSWTAMGQGRTDANGRLQDLFVRARVPQSGLYRLRFDTSAFSAFFPEIVVQFVVSDPEQHYHIPLLLNPFGYTTYRGS